MLIFALGAGLVGWLAGESIRRRRRVGDSALLGAGHRLGQYEYETEQELIESSEAYQDVMRSGGASRSEIEKAFTAYRKAYDQYRKELALRSQLEPMAAEQDRDFWDLQSSEVPSTKEMIQERMKDRLARMEALWPSWYDDYQKRRAYEATGGKPGWMREIEDKVGAAMNLALQILPVAQSARGMRFTMPAIRTVRAPTVPIPASGAYTAKQAQKWERVYGSKFYGRKWGSKPLPFSVIEEPSQPSVLLKPGVQIPAGGSRTIWETLLQDIQRVTPTRVYPTLAPGQPGEPIPIQPAAPVYPFRRGDPLGIVPPYQRQGSLSIPALTTGGGMAFTGV